MARKGFFSFKYDDRAMNVAGQSLADQQTTVIQSLAVLQEI
jgi:hypothetical protein